MTDNDAPQSKGAFSWLRDIFRIRRRPPLTRLRVDPRETLRTQVDIIRLGFDGQVELERGGSEDDADVQFLFRPGHVLIHAEDVGLVTAHFERNQEIYRGVGEQASEPLDGLALFQLPPRHGTGEIDVLGTLDELDRDPDLRVGIATPDHLLYVVPKPGNLCPATEPELPPSNNPVPGLNPNSKAGAKIRVSVIDTGWWPDAAKDSDTPWLATGIEGELEPINTNDIQSYGGHGTFVTGVLRCMAPSVAVEVEAVLKKAGSVFESDIAAQLNQAMLDRDNPQLITISAGTHSRNNLPLKAFEVLSMLQDLKGDNAVLVVAAAGNDGSTDEFWPAAFDWVTAVGSLDANGKRSTFSNYGKWVDVYANGEKLVNAFPTGTYVCKEEKDKNQVRTFTGLAQWSGTSFATPVVTGAIAAYMSEHKVSARKALDALKAAAPKKQDPDIGTATALGPPFM